MTNTDIRQQILPLTAAYVGENTGKWVAGCALQGLIKGQNYFFPCALPTKQPSWGASLCQGSIPRYHVTSREGLGDLEVQRPGCHSQMCDAHLSDFRQDA